MAVPIGAGTTFEPATPVVLFQARTLDVPPTAPRAQYAVTAKGDRFLVNTVVARPAPTPITVVLNWSAALEQSRR